MYLATRRKPHTLANRKSRAAESARAAASAASLFTFFGVGRRSRLRRVSPLEGVPWLT